MTKAPAQNLPNRLLLHEASDILADQLDCTAKHAQNLLERALRSRSLRDVVSYHSDGSELPTDVTAWREIEWGSGIVTIETSFSGSPPIHVPIVPLLDRDELFKTFKIDASRQTEAISRRGGRPIQHDWDSFWVELCRRVHEQGLPATKKELVDKMLDWFADRGNEGVDSRTIEKKISRLFAALNND